MFEFKTKPWRWLAPVALVGAVGLAACGDEDATVSTRNADVGAAVGSDQHLQNQAHEIAARSGSDSGPNVWDAGDRAAAARLTGQAERYAEQQQEEQQQFVPGSRHMPV